MVKEKGFGNRQLLKIEEGVEAGQLGSEGGKNSLVYSNNKHDFLHMDVSGWCCCLLG